MLTSLLPPSSNPAPAVANQMFFPSDFPQLFPVDSSYRTITKPSIPAKNLSLRGLDSSLQLQTIHFYYVPPIPTVFRCLSSSNFVTSYPSRNYASTSRFDSVSNILSCTCILTPFVSRIPYYRIMFHSVTASFSAEATSLRVCCNSVVEFPSP